jgi:hypothetical protein
VAVGADHVMQPSRPAAIRWIVHNFLLKEEAQAKKAGKRKGKHRRA